jgi:hypothetical protein
MRQSLQAHMYYESTVKTYSYWQSSIVAREFSMMDVVFKILLSLSRECQCAVIGPACSLSTFEGMLKAGTQLRRHNYPLVDGVGRI